MVVSKIKHVPNVPSSAKVLFAPSILLTCLIIPLMCGQILLLGNAHFSKEQSASFCHPGVYMRCRDLVQLSKLKKTVRNYSCFDKVH